MAQTPRTPFVQIVPLTGCPHGNSTTSFAQPSLDHPYSTFGSQGYATAAPRRNSQSTVGMERAGPSRGHLGYRPAISERRASDPGTSCYPYLSAEQATHASVKPATRFEVASPKRKAHYVPATPQRVPTPPLSIPRSHSSDRSPYLSPPNSPPSERTSESPRKQAPESPKKTYIPAPPLSPPPSPKRRPTPAPKPRVPHSPISPDDGDELLSKFRRFALAARETPADEKCIEDLMDSYDELMPSLIEEVAVGPHSVLD